MTVYDFCTTGISKKYRYGFCVDVTFFNLITISLFIYLFISKLSKGPLNVYVSPPCILTCKSLSGRAYVYLLRHRLVKF